MWVEVKLSAYSAILVGYVHRNPAVTYAWYDDFVEMMDTVNESNSIIVLLGDFKIGLLKSQPAWESLFCFFGLHLLIRSARRISVCATMFATRAISCLTSNLLVSPLT